jgi:hypothetical protein
MSGCINAYGVACNDSNSSVGINRESDMGEEVGTPALQLTVNGGTCLACKESWPQEDLPWAARLVGAPLPEGVLSAGLPLVLPRSSARVTRHGSSHTTLVAPPRFLTQVSTKPPMFQLVAACHHQLVRLFASAESSEPRGTMFQL